MQSSTRAKTGGRKAGTPNKSRGTPPAPPKFPLAGAREAASGLAIRYLPLDDLVPYDKNARTHTPAQITAIERSLVEFGWAAPMATAEGVLIYGHARREAARSLRDRGVAIPHNPDPNKGPVVDLSHLNEAQRRAYVIADNRLALDSGWDLEILASELIDLRDADFDPLLTGFHKFELDSLFADDPESLPSAAPVEKIRCPTCGAFRTPPADTSKH